MRTFQKITLFQGKRQQHALTVWDLEEVDTPSQKTTVWDGNRTFWDVGVLG